MFSVLLRFVYEKVAGKRKSEAVTATAPSVRLAPAPSRLRAHDWLQGQDPRNVVQRRESPEGSDDASLSEFNVIHAPLIDGSYKQ